MDDAPRFFKEAYLSAWYSLINTSDVRENFHSGDCFEPDAWPSGCIERVAKY